MAFKMDFILNALSVGFFYIKNQKKEFDNMTTQNAPEGNVEFNQKDLPFPELEQGMKEKTTDVVVGKTLLQKLLQVRKQVPYLQKQVKGQQYDFVSGSMVVGALRDELDKQGLLLFPHVIESRMQLMEKANKNGGSRMTVITELKMEFEWVCADTGESKRIPFYAQGLDFEGEKGVGKALTYAEKYFLLKQFNIPTDKSDPDQFQNFTDGLTPNYITNEQINELSSIVFDISQLHQCTGDSILQQLGVPNLAKLEVANFLPAKNMLLQWKQEAQQSVQQQPPVQQEQQQTVQPQIQMFTGSVEVHMFTPPQQLPNGENQLAFQGVLNNEQFFCLIMGDYNVNLFSQVQVGQIINIEFASEGGVNVFSRFI